MATSVRRASSRSGRSGGGLGPAEQTELHKQTQLIRDAPVLDHQPITEPHLVEHSDLEWTPGRRPAEDFTGVDAARDGPDPNLVVVGDQVGDRQREVAEPVMQRADRLLRSLDATVRATLVLDAVGRYKLIADIGVTAAETLLDEPPNGGDVPFDGRLITVHSGCLHTSLEFHSIELYLYSMDMRDVKSPVGSLRAEQAAVTTRRIVAAARRKFRDTGYAATTLREIAVEAGVAVQTVYAVFGSKANILRTLRASVVSDSAAYLAYAAALTAMDLDPAIESFARSIRLRWEAGHDVVMIDTNAAAADPDIRGEVDTAIAARRTGIARLAQRLGEIDHKLDVERAEALLDALTLPTIYEQLVVDHGWTPDAYESWLADTLRRDLQGVASSTPTPTMPSATN